MSDEAKALQAKIDRLEHMIQVLNERVRYLARCAVVSYWPDGERTQ